MVKGGVEKRLDLRHGARDSSCMRCLITTNYQSSSVNGRFTCHDSQHGNGKNHRSASSFLYKSIFNVSVLEYNELSNFKLGDIAEQLNVLFL